MLSHKLKSFSHLTLSKKIFKRFINTLEDWYKDYYKAKLPLHWHLQNTFQNKHFISQIFSKQTFCIHSQRYENHYEISALRHFQNICKHTQNNFQKPFQNSLSTLLRTDTRVIIKQTASLLEFQNTFQKHTKYSILK